MNGRTNVELMREYLEAVSSMESVSAPNDMEGCSAEMTVGNERGGSAQANPRI
jgi:hypothetical protein